MDFCRKTLTALTLTALSLPSLAHYLPQELELMLGYNYSSHSNNKIHLGVNNTEIDSLHQKGSGSDIIGGLAYAYNVFPQPEHAHSFVQRVWVGLDLIFMNNTETGDVYLSQNPSNAFYDFELEEKTTRLMVNTEVDFGTRWAKVLPFVQASVGAARILAQYKETIEPGLPFTGGAFRLSNEVNYNLAYSLGAGVKFLVKPNLQAGFSYLFTDFGIIKTEDESNSVVLSEPIKDHLVTSSAFFNLSYLF
jgi:opacity protein-like surface antigen